MKRVISLNGFSDEDTGEFYGYGQEFDVEEGPKLDGWLAAKHVRIDERVKLPPPTKAKT